MCRSFTKWDDSSAGNRLTEKARLIEHELVDELQDGFVFAVKTVAGIRELHKLQARGSKRRGEFFGVLDGYLVEIEQPA